mgnify:CR=1 FL=1
MEVPVNPLDTGRGRDSVGEDVNGTEGVDDGTSDGALDGAEVGAGVGNLVGAEVGNLVGAGVGGMGALDGFEVGVIGTVSPL